ncbi:alpha/beta hydrolase [Novosphingobium percolationis]|uniref:alpha/beta hydrolase n=1 Tax=Novosphingobium percolationis TaxID=2871811 RepID=UPI001CD2FDFC|nr:alpha/beta hydrolase [Novosphingobium percolationis]
MSNVNIDPEMADLAEALSAPGLPSITNSPPDVMRAVLSQVSPTGGPDMHSVADACIAGVSVRDYRPSARPRATILFIHGGGWVVGSVADYDSFARTLAARTGCRVVSVEYRLAPEHPFPAAVEDVCAVYRELSPDGPLFVGGDSAGGNLSAVLAQVDRDSGGGRLAGQILIYPSVAGDTDTEAMRAFAPPFMGLEEISAFYDLYVPDRGQRADPRFAPARGVLVGLVPALVITAGADLLAAEAQDYACALAQAGCDVTTHHQDGAPHAYLTLAPASSAADATLAQIARFIDRHSSQSQ